jgi:DNA gyrase subunit A
VERVYEIPEGSRASKGRSIANFSSFARTRKSPRPFESRARKRRGDLDDKLHIVFATRSGIVKKSNLSEFKNIRKGGIIAIQIEAEDCLIDCKLTSGLDEIVLITHDGMSIRFNEEELRDQGRNTVGVWGIRPTRAITWWALPW